MIGQPITLTLTLTANEINTIFKGLGKLPLEDSFGVFINVQAQVDAQTTPPPATKEKEA